MKRSRVLAVVAVLVVGAALGTFVLLDRAEDQAARAVAERYVELVESGEVDDLPELQSFTASEHLGALRTAGGLLVDAQQRIEVVSVEDAGELDANEVDVGFDFALDSLVAFDVDYRLGGETHEGRIVLGAMAEESGRSEDDWRVVVPLTGSIDWPQRNITLTDTDLFVSGVRQVRAPGSAGEDQVQPLYPAVYEAQRRNDPWYASPAEEVVVTAGEPVSPPEATLEPTDRTTRRLTREARDQVAQCAFADGHDCPLTDIAEDLGAEPYSDNSWFLGVVGTPRLTFTDTGLELTGTVRIRGTDGPRRVRWTALAKTFLDTNDWKPYLAPFTAQRVRP